MTSIDYRAHIERCLTNSGMQPYGAADLIEGLTRQIRDGYPAEAETHQRALDAEAKLAEVRATNQRLNQRCQQAESKLATYERAVGEWELSERGTYVPLRTLTAIARAVGRPVEAGRYELHYQRVERAEAAIALARALHQPDPDGRTGWCPDDDDTPGAYGNIAQACQSCGSNDTAVRWPCPTIRALGSTASVAAEPGPAEAQPELQQRRADGDAARLDAIDRTEHANLNRHHLRPTGDTDA